MMPDLALTEPQRLLCRAIADEPAGGPGGCGPPALGNTRGPGGLCPGPGKPGRSLVAHVLMEISGSEVSAPWRQAHEETFQRLSSTWAA